MTLDAIRALIAEDFAAVDQLIRAELRSDVALVNQLGDYIVAGGGKRLRPILVLLAARACGGEDARQVALAAIIEFIHTATLLHDDVVDASELRRGRETANTLWGNEASVLVGDFLYSRAFQMMVGIGNPRVMEIMADATNLIAEGEVLQLMNCGDPETTEARYLEVIRRKTATLFQAGARLGAVVLGHDGDTENALADFGLHLGIAFQLVDDALDYSASAVTLGKNVGDDLAEGKPTLPLIYAMAHGSPEQHALISKAICDGGLTHIDTIQTAIRQTGALEYTRELARKHADSALQQLSALPASVYRDGLQALVEFSLKRDH